MTVLIDVECLVKDVRERLYRGTTTPRDVEDLLDALDGLREQADELRADAEAEEGAHEETARGLVTLFKLVRDASPAGVPREEVEAWALDQGWTPAQFAKAWPVSAA
jgi:hypothetical protein